mmetsp:Transcript_34271/g.79059  ORF Transcript_34271/g.79059 Transcript_34271/m.79059 type:complete len:251 (-) Transcript_34271:1193-1945(-)
MPQGGGTWMAGTKRNWEIYKTRHSHGSRISKNNWRMPRIGLAYWRSDWEIIITPRNPRTTTTIVVAVTSIVPRKKSNSNSRRLVHWVWWFVHSPRRSWWIPSWPRMVVLTNGRPSNIFSNRHRVDKKMSDHRSRETCYRISPSSRIQWSVAVLPEKIRDTTLIITGMVTNPMICRKQSGDTIPYDYTRVCVGVPAGVKNQHLFFPPGFFVFSLPKQGSWKTADSERGAPRKLFFSAQTQACQIETNHKPF